MRLDQSLYAQVVRFIDATPEPGKVRGRRRCMRHHADVEITIKPFGVVHPTPRQVRLVDLSPHGIGIVDQRAASTGDRFVAYLPLPDGKTHPVLCAAQHSRLTSGGGFRVGAEFVEQQQEHRLLSGVEGVIDENKLDPSHHGSQRAIVHGPSGATDATIRSYSDGAVELLVAQQLAPGQDFILELHLPKRVVNWRCTVVNVSPAADDRLRIIATNNGEVAKSRSWRSLFNWFRRESPPTASP